MINRGIIFLLLFFGLLFVSVGVIRDNNICPSEKIVYRYIPRSFEESQNEPVYVSDIFKTMFSQSSPWVNSMGSYDRNKQEQINQYFISQS